MISAFKQMPPLAKLWVYAANRKLTDQEQVQIMLDGESFISEWTAHQQQLKASFGIVYDTFIVICVDENYNQVSGCGIDKSVHFLQQLEIKYQLDLFNRMQIELWLDENVLMINKQKLAAMIQAGTANDKTQMFNKRITTKQEFDVQFLITVDQSWLYPA